MKIDLINNTLNFKISPIDIIIYEDLKITKICNAIYFNLLYDTFGCLGKDLLRNNYKRLVIEIKELTSFTTTSIIFNIIRIARLIGIEQLTILY